MSWRTNSTAQRSKTPRQENTRTVVIFLGLILSAVVMGFMVPIHQGPQGPVGPTGPAGASGRNGNNATTVYPMFARNLTMSGFGWNVTSLRALGPETLNVTLVYGAYSTISNVTVWEGAYRAYAACQAYCSFNGMAEAAYVVTFSFSQVQFSSGNSYSMEIMGYSRGAALDVTWGFSL